MTDIPPPAWIKYCPLCMSRHNGGHIMGNHYPVDGRCSSCGKYIDEKKSLRQASAGCFRFKFDEIIESQISDEHRFLLFDKKEDAYNYAIETWGSSVADNYVKIQQFDGRVWR